MLATSLFALGLHDWSIYNVSSTGGRCVPPGQCTPPSTKYSRVVTGPVPVLTARRARRTLFDVLKALAGAARVQLVTD